MKLAVFMGGSSPEREVSLASGRAVAEALEKRGHRVVSHDVRWSCEKRTLFSAVDTCLADGTDVVFLALHGGLGENGGVQGVLEAAGIPYTGTGVTGSAVAMDKDITKQLFTANGIPTAQWTVLSMSDSLPDIRDSIGFPCVVKPADLGSTIGLTVVESETALAEACETAFSYSGKIMIEAYIPGSELTVPVLGDTALPVIEIKPSHAIYDYECKYTPGMTDYLVPAPIGDELAADLGDTALRVFRLLGLRHIARIDFRLDAGGIPLCFEANTLPGMTGTSLVPKSARAAGIEFPDLVTRIAEMAAAGH